MPDDIYRPDAAERIKRGDMRDMQKARCTMCKHEWFAPVIGRCPKCRAEGAEILDQLMLGAARV